MTLVVAKSLPAQVLRLFTIILSFSSQCIDLPKKETGTKSSLVGFCLITLPSVSFFSKLGAKRAQELLKQIFTVNCIFSLKVPTVALWMRIISPILCVTGKSSNFEAKNTTLTGSTAPSVYLLVRSMILRAQMNLSLLKDLWGKEASRTTP